MMCTAWCSLRTNDYTTVMLQCSFTSDSKIEFEKHSVHHTIFVEIELEWCSAQ